MNDSIIVYRNPFEKAAYEFYSENPMALVYIVLAMFVILFLVYIISHIREYIRTNRGRQMIELCKEILFH